MLIALVLTFCQKDDPNETNFGLNCKTLHDAIISSYSYYSDSIKVVIKSEFDKLTNDLTPKPSLTDNLGQLSNFYSLFKRLEICSDLSFYICCYACIQTGIPQSEVLVFADSSGIQIRRILDFDTWDKMNLKCISIHGYYSGSCDK